MLYVVPLFEVPFSHLVMKELIPSPPVLISILFLDHNGAQ